MRTFADKPGSRVTRTSISTVHRPRDTVILKFICSIRFLPYKRKAVNTWWPDLVFGCWSSLYLRGHVSLGNEEQCPDDSPNSPT
ncbi:hypothetical protein EVAR_72777_1 [Eumeta japonica]|uniref:Uncharacterized protein n=1 Tax=Eumeta variegata TaxID=151549 RepID=A0A4C2AH70_EUMVA|nr:hypothetical protein EVAR_72777_1 [Eumeta japonica]